MFLHDEELKCVVPDKTGKYANKPVDAATNQRLEPDAKSGDISSLTAAPMVMGQYNDLEEDEGGHVFALTGEDTCEENGGSSCVALQAHHNELFCGIGAARSVCPKSFEPEVPYQQSHKARGSRAKHFVSKVCALPLVERPRVR